VTEANSATPRKRGAQPHNANARTHGFYSDSFTLDELALVAALTEQPSLDDEVWMQRVMNRRLLQRLTSPKPITDAKLFKVAAALAVGTGRVARLLRDRRSLQGEESPLAKAVAEALDLLADEMDEKL